MFGAGTLGLASRERQRGNLARVGKPYVTGVVSADLHVDISARTADQELDRLALP